MGVTRMMGTTDPTVNDGRRFVTVGLVVMMVSTIRGSSVSNSVVIFTHNRRCNGHKRSDGDG